MRWGDCAVLAYTHETLRRWAEGSPLGATRAYAATPQFLAAFGLSAADQEDAERTLLEVAGPDPRATRTALADLPGAGSSHVLGDVVRVLWRGPADEADEAAEAIRAHCAAAGLPLPDVRVTKVDMETAFAVLAEAGQ